jgi:hypothetical protein
MGARTSPHPSIQLIVIYLDNIINISLVAEAGMYRNFKVGHTGFNMALYQYLI